MAPKGGKGETERGRNRRGTGLNDKTKGGPSYDDINAAKVWETFDEYFFTLNIDWYIKMGEGGHQVNNPYL